MNFFCIVVESNEFNRVMIVSSFSTSQKVFIFTINDYYIEQIKEYFEEIYNSYKNKNYQECCLTNEF